MGKVFRGLPLPPLKPKFVPPTVDWASKGAEAEVTFSGFKALIANLKLIPPASMDAAGSEMESILDEVMLDSQTNYVPIDSGALHDSADHDIYTPGKGVSLIQMAVWYAGDAVVGDAIYGMQGRQVGHGSKGLTKAHGLNEAKNPKLYALEQHENLTLNHPTGGKAKYLEIPFNERQTKVWDRIANAISTSLGFTSLGSIESGLRDAPSYPGYGGK